MFNTFNEKGWIPFLHGQSAFTKEDVEKFSNNASINKSKLGAKEYK